MTLTARIALSTFILGCGTEVIGVDAGDSRDTGMADAGAVDDGGEGECTAGSSRVAACGNCGVATEVCSPDRRWELAGECTGEGECAPGEMESQAIMLCGEEQRTCTAECTWGAWTVRMPPGECTPGEERVDEAACPWTDYQLETCTDACMWTAPACVNPCGGARRTEPADAEEICIPAGPFIRGDADAYPPSQTVREVTLSAYYIDRFPVSNERYQQCVDAGACTIPVTTEGATSLSDPARGRYPVEGINRTQALAFCAWDGGRTLPTEAQWEKAARGPAPRSQDYTWEGPFECARVRCSSIARPIPVEIDGLSGETSYYGVEMMLGGGYEWMSDFYDPSYYSRDESLTDPAGPSTGGTYVCRGRPSGSMSGFYYNVSQRWTCDDGDMQPVHTLRCARRGV